MNRLNEEILKLEKFLKTLANKRRLAVLKHLAKVKTATLSDLAEVAGISEKSMSKHLQFLDNVGLIEKTTSGVQVVCSLAHDHPEKYKDVLEAVAKILK